MREALTMDMLATDLADYLVRKGVSSITLLIIETLEFITDGCRSLSVKHITSLVGRSRLQSQGSVICMS
jgi:hypothetical protein